MTYPEHETVGRLRFVAHHDHAGSVIDQYISAPVPTINAGSFEDLPSVYGRVFWTENGVRMCRDRDGTTRALPEPPMFVDPTRRDDLKRLRARWAAAHLAWSRDDCTDTVKTVKLGEDMMYAATDLISRLDVDA